jgi:hypothetical protein
MIGNLTNDMMRLCSEITALRDTRAQGRDELRDAVAQKLAEFQNSRKEMANKVRTELDEFVGGIKDAVTELRQQFMVDLAGARRAWCGSLSMAVGEEAPKDIAPKAKKKRR